MPDISFIILNFNQRGLTRECVKNFLAHKTRAMCEIIVVDNSNDVVLKETLATRYPAVRYIPMEKNVGFAAGNNRGIEAARGRYCAITNYDITPRPGALDALLSYMDDHPDVGVAGPQLFNPDGTIQQSYYRFYSLLTPLYRRLFLGKWRFAKKNLDAFLMAHEDMSQPRDVDWLLGAFLMVRTSALKNVGMFDDRFFLYFEDTDWCRRFWVHGWRVQYVPQSQMLHLHLRESAHTMGIRALTEKSTRIHIYSGMRYFFKQWSGAYKKSH